MHKTGFGTPEEARDGSVETHRQAALLKTGALQDAIFNSAYFSSIATDEHGVIQIFNVGAQTMLGYAASDVVNKITPADISDPQELIARAVALSGELDVQITPGFEALVFKASRGIEDIYELTYIRKDGSRFPAMVSVTALRDVQERIIGYLLIGADNTARKQIETERALLEQALREKLELEHANRMKSEFLATMSHELRTPLNAIIGFSEALKDGLMGAMSATQQEYVGDIFASGQHLLSLINDILDLSKVEAGMMALDLEAVDLNALLSNSLTIVRERAATQRIMLELEIGEGLGVLSLDTRKTKQIVYNLLSNAVKFSPMNARVVLRARSVSRASVGRIQGDWPLRRFALADNEFSEFVEISVCDVGIGISSANMDRLFQAFTQIDSSLARRFEGTGLGLAMVKQLVELHGGTVAVASREGKGAHFVVWLPLRAPQGANGVTRAHALSENLFVAEASERKALVVEDDDQTADLIRLLLEAEGFSVVRACSGEAALLVAPTQSFSLITLDLQLPGIDGWEFLVRIRQLEALAGVPVVIISCAADLNLALRRGAAAILQKPISRAALKASLSDLGLFPVEARTHTVLVVDDDPKAVQVIAAFLPAPAYNVVCAYGGSEAIVLAQRLRPDLILLDLMMPLVSGFEVVTALQRNEHTARIPILIVTARQITALDRAQLNSGNSARVIHMTQKAGFNRTVFVEDVRRALQPA